jgi:hypothetical protein
MTSQTQTANDYKEYFMGKFVGLFKEFVGTCGELVCNEEVKTDLNKISQLFGKLNYEKIMLKLTSNTSLQELMKFMEIQHFSDETVFKLIKSNSKVWSLMPSLYIDKILSSMTSENRVIIGKIFHGLLISAISYLKVSETIKGSGEVNEVNETNKDFNPFVGIGSMAENMDISTMYNGVEVKTFSAYEMLMEQLVNQEMEGKMKNYMENIQEDDVKQAADKLTDVLNNENFKGNKETTKILGDMLSKIKNEVINLKNSPEEKTSGKQGVEQLLNIAQKVASGMMTSIKSNNINVLDLWDATSSLAKNTTNSSALTIIDKLIRTNIENSMKMAQKNNAGEEMNGVNPNEYQKITDGTTSGKKEKKEKNKKKKKSKD